jgi:hypothetical protein
MDANLMGSPSTIDPWPASLVDVTPFTLDLNGAVALDAKALKEQLGISEPSVSTAIVSFYMSSPVTIDSPVLGGRLRAVAIDRTGFDTALPEVTLPGGDSEQCFSAGGKTELLLAGTLVQR